jgi:hypothetical protein
MRPHYIGDIMKKYITLTIVTLLGTLVLGPFALPVGFVAGVVMLVKSN